MVASQTDREQAKTGLKACAAADVADVLAAAGVQIWHADGQGIYQEGPNGPLETARSFRSVLRQVGKKDRSVLSNAVRTARQDDYAICNICFCDEQEEAVYYKVAIHHRTDNNWIFALVDVSDEEKRIRSLELSEDHLRNIVEYNPQLPWIADPEGNIVDFTDRWLASTGMSRNEAAGAGWLAATHPDDVEKVNEEVTHSLQSGQSFDVRVRLEVNGEYRWMRAQGYPQHDEDGNIKRWYGYTEDIHESVLVEQQIRWNAEHDALTGLPNRSLFNRHLSEACEKAMESLEKVGVLMVDLDNFKDVNDLHVVGIFPDYQSAYDAWKAEAQRTVDNAHMRYFIAHLHRLRDEAAEASSTEEIG